MRFVEKADIRPMRCAVCPTIGAAHPEGYIDTGAEMQPAPVDQRVYVSVVGVRELMRVLGWPTPEAYEALSDENGRLEAELADANDDLMKQDTYLSAIDVLESHGFQARRKSGRPRKAETEEQGV